MNVYTVLDDFTFTASGLGDLTIFWVGVLQWQANASRSVKMFLSLDMAPVYSGGIDTQYTTTMTYNGNGNAQTSTVVLSYTFSGLSAGTHTAYIRGKALLSGANQPLLDINAFTYKIEAKK